VQNPIVAGVPSPFALRSSPFALRPSLFALRSSPFALRPSLFTALLALSSAAAQQPAAARAVAPAPDTAIIRGLYVNRFAAQSPKRMRQFIAIADSTEINALVIDVKDEFGLNFAASDPAVAKNAGRAGVIPRLTALLDTLRAHRILAVARIVVFKDSVTARVNPAWTIRREDGSPWRDKEGLTWVNPFHAGLWDYNIRVAEEAVRLGFGEVQFDYIRFPSEEAAQSSGQLEMAEADRVAVIEAFVHAASTRVRARGCAVSADVFGIIVSARNDQGIGQHPEEMSRHLDAFSPMIYPSHYSDGWLGFEDPNEHPYDVTSDAIEDGLARIQPGVVLRPWLQAFWWTDEQIRRSIQAAEDHEVGWILWNAVSNFDPAAIPTDAELAPASQ